MTIIDADVTGTDTMGRALMFAASYTDQLRRVGAGPGGWKFTVRDIDLYSMTPVLQSCSNAPGSRFADV